MTRLQRVLANLCGGWFQLRRRFPTALLDEMAEVIAVGERAHRGELCFAIESRLDPLAVLGGLDARQRAGQLFSQLRVWDTEQNCGVLIYILMAERRIEIVADRGIARRVGEAEWSAICADMHRRFALGQWREGCLEGIAAAQGLLQQHFPGDDQPRPDELPDRPLLL